MHPRYELLTEPSSTVHGHKYVLPVAAWILDNDVATATQPDVREGLGGGEANRVLEALERLDGIGAMKEMPYPGRPAKRVFERQASVYWRFVEKYVPEVQARSAAGPPPAQPAGPPPLSEEE